MPATRFGTLRTVSFLGLTAIVITTSLAATILPARGETLEAPCEGSLSPDDRFDDRCEAWLGVYDGGDRSGPGYGLDIPTRMTVAPGTGIVVATGISWSGSTAGGYNYGTVAFDSAGRRLWTATHDGPMGLRDFATSIASSPDGTTVFVTGIEDFRSTPDYASTATTIAYETLTGAIRWVAQTDGVADPDWQDIGIDLAVSPDGSQVYMAAQSQTTPSQGAYDAVYTTVTLDAVTGQTLWSATQGGGGTWRPSALGVTPDGSTVIVTGGTLSGGTVSTVAYGTGVGGTIAGRRLWTASYKAALVQWARELSIDPDGSRVYVVGDRADSSGSQFLTLAYDVHSGALSWSHQYAGPEGHEGYGPHVTAAGGRVFVAGRIAELEAGVSYDDADLAVVAYEAASGNELWTAGYDSTSPDLPHTGGNDIASAIDASPDGSSIFVTGVGSISGAATWTNWGFGTLQPFTKAPSGTAATTLAFDAYTGVRRWLARYSPAVAVEGGAWGFDVEVSPDGTRLYTLSGGSPTSAADGTMHTGCGGSGQCAGSGNTDDYRVLAYETS